MILVLGGTVEGREIANLLSEQGYNVLLTVVSRHGKAMVPPEANIEVLVQQLDDRGIKQLAVEKQVKIVVDATHPYAAVISDIAAKAAAEIGITYIRFTRKEAVAGVVGRSVHRALNYNDAARIAFTLGNIVFLTIGSKNIQPFVNEGVKSGKRVIVRVLPDPAVIQQCIDSGLNARDIIAVQGPFSEEMNLAMLKEYKAEVLVTKDSGRAGGTDAKLAAAAELGLPVVVITRPEKLRPEAMSSPLLNDINQLIEQVRLVYPKS